MNRRNHVAMLLLVLALPAPADGRTPEPTYATSYCLYGRTASGYVLDGDQGDRRTAASNWLPLGTRIRLTGRSFYGLRRFVVRDTGPALADGHIDLWHPSCHASRIWGARRITYKLGWRKP